MVESPDYVDPVHGIPVFSLYGEVRRPTAAMMDVRRAARRPAGPRLPHLYVHHDAALRARGSGAARQDRLGARPPESDRTTGRGSEPEAGLGELRWRRRRCRCGMGSRSASSGTGSSTVCKLDVDYRVIEMRGWRPRPPPGFGWPLGERTWINPSPNAPNLSMARCYPGTVMLEGTTLSEGRGTTRPLEVFGAPDLDARRAASRRCSGSRPTGSPAAGCGRAGSSRRFTSTRGSSVRGRADPCRGPGLRPRRVPAMATAGARVQGAAPACDPTIRCGATSPTSTSTTGWRST